MNQRRTAFTLVELLVVIAIIGVLVGLLLPAVQSAREASRRMQGQNNLKQLGLALHNHESAFKRFPAGAIHQKWDQQPTWTDGHWGWGVFANLLPFIEQTSLHGNLQLDMPLLGAPPTFPVNPEHVDLVDQTIPMYLCPSDLGTVLDERYRPINYTACLGSGLAGPDTKTGSDRDADGVFYVNSDLRPADILDGLSNTLAMSETILGPGGGDGDGSTSVRPQQTVERIDELNATVQPVPAKAMDGVARAFTSAHREERVTAIIACGKSKRVSTSMKDILLGIASEDSDPLARAAALQSLYRLGRPSLALKSLSTKLRSDPLLGPVTEQLSKAKRK